MALWKWALGMIASNIISEQIYNEMEKNIITQKAYEYARRRGKPVLDFGCGFRPRGDFNVDVKPRNAKNFILIQSFDKPLLPFSDKFFASALALHVIEHTANPENALKELHRVAEKVFIATPKPHWILTWLHPDHKHIFFTNEVYIKNPLYRDAKFYEDVPLLYLQR